MYTLVLLYIYFVEITCVYKTAVMLVYSMYIYILTFTLYLSCRVLLPF